LPHTEERSIKIKGISPLVLLGPNDINLKILERAYTARIVVRGENITLRGDASEVHQLEEIFTELIFLANKKSRLDSVDVETVIRLVKTGRDEHSSESDGVITHKNLNAVVLFTHKGFIEAKSDIQKSYIREARQNDIIFAIGPAGTGKTYLAVAIAVAALKNKEVDRIVLSRPAVETGESLGFLPGDMHEKIDPYLRPLYDALHDMIPSNKLQDYMAHHVIEIVPLAYMRGRTLSNAFVILDEAQNTTPTQMKMFLTRLGANARAIVTGDISQSDLPRGMMSGLREVKEILTGIEGISFVYFDKNDVVRHKLVRDIINAYDAYDDEQTGAIHRKNLSIKSSNE